MEVLPCAQVMLVIPCVRCLGVTSTRTAVMVFCFVRILAQYSGNCKYLRRCANISAKKGIRSNCNDPTLCCYNAITSSKDKPVASEMTSTGIFFSLKFFATSRFASKIALAFSECWSSSYINCDSYSARSLSSLLTVRSLKFE